MTFNCSAFLFARREVTRKMSVNLYALFTYALTAAISFLVIAVVVVLNKFLGSKPDKIDKG